MHPTEILSHPPESESERTGRWLMGGSSNYYLEAVGPGRLFAILKSAQGPRRNCSKAGHAARSGKYLGPSWLQFSAVLQVG